VISNQNQKISPIQWFKVTN